MDPHEAGGARVLRAEPPFVLRARVLTPLAAGGMRYLADGVIEVDGDGRIASVGENGAAGATAPSAAMPTIDLRDWLVLPGLVDLHAHIPQLPNAGVGAGLDLLAWLERYTLPLERAFDAATAARIAPAVFRAFAAAGTTTLVAYVTTDPAATEATFVAAEAHGIRAVIGHVLMDRLPGGGDLPPGSAGLEASAALCTRWDGRDGGRLRYAVTPRFAVSCSADLLRASARLARDTGAYWQTHLSEDPRELAEVRRAFPEALDYLDVYERAGVPAERTLYAHAIHLSDGEVDRLAGSGSAVAHCPASNLFLPSGVMPLARYMDAGIRVGLGSDVSGGPDPSIFEVMRVGAYAHHALMTLAGERRAAPDPMAWLRLGTLEGARALGLGDVIGSIEAGKDADLIAVDPAATDPLPGAGRADDPSEAVSRLIFRTRPGMVRGAWVRGRRLPA